MVPTRIPDTVNSANIARACRDADMQTLCDHGAWNNGRDVVFGWMGVCVCVCHLPIIMHERDAAASDGIESTRSVQSNKPCSAPDDYF